jgi:hypothetical protein
MNKVKLGLRGLNDDQIVALANTIKTAMTGNANFTTPNPTLAALSTALTAASTKVAAYNSAVAAAQTALAERDAAVQALCTLLTQLASYVENTAAGDAAKIESAGLAVRGQGSPVGPLPQVPDLVLTAGDNEGTLDAAWDPVYGASSYEVQVSVDPVSSTSWAYKMTASKSSATVVALASGTRMWARVRAIGAGNQPGPWSDPAVKTVP